MQLLSQGLTEIEYHFWQITIPLMLESVPVQKLIHFAYMSYTRYSSLPKSIKATVWAISGWAIGVVFGLISLVLI